ncbi:MAG: tetratricopeptide repeat protein [Thermodesulfobacteriota bacterium]|nr:tetratricopeptide repeat protein [Thermodesulfobacteriota bacterium]
MNGKQWRMAALTAFFSFIAIVGAHAGQPGETTVSEDREPVMDRQFWSQRLGHMPPVVENTEQIPEWQTRLELARLLTYQEKYEEALAQYRKVLAEKPDMMDVKIEKALVLQYMGETDQAFKTLDGLALTDVPPESIKQIADVYAAAKQYKTAEQLYQTYLRTHSGDLSVRFKLARVLSWDGQYDKSLEQYEWILQRRPDDIQVRRHYATVLIWAGRQQDAARQLEQTLEDQ